MKKLNKKGFTITELVIVVSVIAILSAVLIPTFSDMIKKSKDSAAVQDAKTAYTQYLYDAAEKGTEKVYENFIYKYDGNRCVVILNGDLVKENDSVKLYTEDAATTYLKAQLALVEDNAETTDVNEKNYTTEDITPIKFIAYAKNN